MDLMEKLAENAIRTSYDDLSEKAVYATKMGVLDTIGCMIAGVCATKKEADLVMSWGGTPQAPVYLYGTKLPLPNAAFLNSCISYAIDYDAQVSFHDMACMVPTAMTLADYTGHVSGKEFITAIAACEDLQVRINDSANYKARHWGDKYRLFCPGGTIVIFGTAALSARMLHLDYEGMMNALGLVYERCGTTDAPACEKSECVRIQMGLTARNGVESALLAKAGIKGIPNILQGQHGWFVSFAQAEKEGDLNLNKITDGLGKVYQIERLVDNGLKVYSACGTTIPGALAAAELVEKHHLDYKKIRKIVVETASQGHSITGHPLTYNVGDIPDPAEGKFCQPYMIANGIIRKHCELKHFTEEYMMDKDIIELAHKVEPIATSDNIGKSARLHLEMEDGTTYDIVRMASENPFRSLDETEDKFWEMVEFGPNLPKDKCRKIVELVNRLETLEDVSELTQLLQ